MTVLMQLLIGTIFILVGIKTMIRKKTTLILRLWSWGGDDPRSPGGGFSESVQTGLVAFLLGVLEVIAGVSILAGMFMAH